LFDLGQTYLEEGKDAVLKRARPKDGSRLSKRSKKSQPMDDTSPICWQAKAWVARCYHELGGPLMLGAALRRSCPPAPRPPGQAAGALFRLAGGGRSPVAPDPDEKGKVPALILEARQSWLRDYPAYRYSNEAQGLRYLLATTYLGKPKPPRWRRTKKGNTSNRNGLLSAIETTENEFTDRARRLQDCHRPKSRRF